MAQDVFISYSSKDKSSADAMVSVLEQQGIRCWVAPRDIRPGEDYAEAIINGIAECRLMVLILSSHSNVSNHVRREIERAVSKGATIVPFRVEDVALSKSLEYHISTHHWLDAFTPPLENHLNHLATVVNGFLKNELSVVSKVPPSVTPRNSSVPRPKFQTWHKLALAFTGLALLVVLTPCVLAALWLRSMWQGAEAQKKLIDKQNQNLSAEVGGLLSSLDKELAGGGETGSSRKKSGKDSLGDAMKSVSNARGMVDALSKTNLDLKGSKLTALDFSELEKYGNLRELDLRATQFDGAALARLPRSIETLHLESSSLDDAGLKQLAELRELRKLYLDQTKITNSGLESLRRLSNLQHLSLTGTSISDNGLAELSGCGQLAFLYLDETPVTGSGFAKFGRRAYYDISLRGTKLDDAGLMALSKIPTQKLDLRETQITDAGLASLHKQDFLNTLIIDTSTVSTQALDALKSARKNLKIEL